MHATGRFLLNSMSKLTQYLRDTRAELAYVKWPSRSQAIGFTLLVIVISIATAFLLGFFDYVLSLIIQKFVL
jgi:preprotein translocase SecE subunit